MVWRTNDPPAAPLTLEDIAEAQTELAWDILLERIADLCGRVQAGEMAVADAACLTARQARLVERVALRIPGAPEDFSAAEL